jgi:CheY-like chemotaxis protein
MSLLRRAADSPNLGRSPFDPIVRHRISLVSADLDAPNPGIAPAYGEARLPLVASGRRILVVDDEPDIRRMLREVLEEEGYAVGLADDGEDGLAMIRASAHPLIVLVDYKMPRMNGPELLHAVLADPQLAGRHAFIFVTANRPAFSPDLLQLLETGAIPVIEKPFTIALLLTAVERASGRLRAPSIDSTDPTC